MTNPRLKIALKFLKNSIASIIEMKENDMKLIKDTAKKQEIGRDLEELRRANKALAEAGELNEGKQKKAIEEAGKVIDSIAKRKNKVTPFKN